MSKKPTLADCIYLVLWSLKDLAPVRRTPGRSGASPFPGNLKQTIREVSRTNKQGSIVVGGAPAPYFPYTNEPWKSPRWKGATNPNEGWADIAEEDALNKILNTYGGKLI